MARFGMARLLTGLYSISPSIVREGGRRFCGVAENCWVNPRGWLSQSIMRKSSDHARCGPRPTAIPPKPALRETTPMAQVKMALIGFTATMPENGSPVAGDDRVEPHNTMDDSFAKRVSLPTSPPRQGPPFPSPFPPPFPSPSLPPSLPLRSRTHRFPRPRRCSRAYRASSLPPARTSFEICMYNARRSIFSCIKNNGGKLLYAFKILNINIHT
jgi:hypothetical protein